MEYYARSKRMLLFATRSDYLPIIQCIEDKFDLQYVRLGMFPTPQMQIVHSALDLEDLGVSFKGDEVHDNHYMVVNSEMEITIREVPQRNGDSRYEVWGEFPSAIFFTPGGLYNNTCLITGEIETSSTHQEAKKLFNFFSKEIKKRFTRINIDWLGPEALALFNSGNRCTKSIHMPAEYNLSRD